MKDAIAIIAHAVRMLFFNPATTLRVLMPALVFILLGAAILLIWAPGLSQRMLTDPMLASRLTASDTFPILGSMILTLFGYILMAVLWHRHVLLSDGTPERPSAGIIGSYLWKAILVGLLQLLIFLPVGFVAGIIIAATGMPLNNGILTAAFQFLGIWVALRVSVILPAAALGRPMRIGESWEATQEVSGTIWALAFLIALINFAVPMITTPLINITSALSTIVSVALTAFVALIFVSVLTTLYGHLVEKRPLG